MTVFFYYFNPGTVLSAVVDIEPLRTSTNETNTTKTVVAYPVRSSLDTANTTAGALLSVMVWDFFFENMLPSDVKGIVCVLKDNAGQMYAYELNGDTVSNSRVFPRDQIRFPKQATLTLAYISKNRQLLLMSLHTKTSTVQQLRFQSSKE